MKGMEAKLPKEKPKLIGAQELVDQLSIAGPGSDIRVRIHFGDGSTKLGIVKWSDDRVKGPVVVIPNKKNSYDEALLPLGGQTIFRNPPRISSAQPAKGLPLSSILSTKKEDHRPFRQPINPDADKLKFEIIES